MNKKFLVTNLCLLLVLLSAISCAAQDPSEGYRIEIRLDRTEEPVLYLGFYYQGRTYIQDTADLVKKTTYIFQDTEREIYPGFFFLLNAKKEILYELVVGEDTHFSLQLPSFSSPEETVVDGDPDNALYFEMIRLNANIKEKADPLIAILNDKNEEENTKKEARNKLEAINRDITKQRNALEAKDPKRVISKFIRSKQKVDLSEFSKNEDGSQDSSKRFYYYRDHFFDNMPLSDPIYLRFAPVSIEPLRSVVEERVEEYLEKMHLQIPDTIIAAIDRLAAACGDNKQTLTHVIWYCTTKYQKPKYMGQDKIFVHIYDTYYTTGRMDSWANNKLKEQIKKVADRYRLSLLDKIAPDLAMQDINRKRKSLYEMNNAYRIIYFFNPNCSSCSKETPRLRKMVQESEHDIGVFAVDTDTSMTAMRKYITDMSIADWTVVNGPRSYLGPYQESYDAFATPTLMIINKENRIIAKKIPAEKINEFLTNYEAMLRQKATKEKK